jgi:hypothetical protein
MHFVRTVTSEHRSGKTISKATRVKLATAAGHLKNAGVSLGAVQGHLDDLIGDGTTSGGTGGGPNGNGPGIGAPDGTGSRSADDEEAEMRRFVRKTLRHASRDRAESIERALLVAEENHREHWSVYT